MITSTKILENQSIGQYLKNTSYYISDGIEQIVFFDIETTGFSARTTYCYLIGCIYYKDEQWQSIQWFAENANEEVSVISTFFLFLRNFHLLIHFNGTSFDMPYLLERCRRLQLTYNFEAMQSLDLYKKAKGIQKLLKLENYKQKSIEQFLGIIRDDKFSGGELIETYLGYIKTQGQDALKLLLLHNYDDLCGLPLLLCILGYSAITDGNFSINELVIQDSYDYEGMPIKEAIFSMHLPAPLPIQVSYGKEPFYITAYQQSCKLRIRLYTGELKYFYKNYKDYYYLLGEDCSIHKSVAFYVDKNFRTQAKAANCYSKKTGMFLSQFHEIISPCFRLEFHDQHSYFEVDDLFKNDKTSQYVYVRDIISQIL